MSRKEMGTSYSSLVNMIDAHYETSKETLTVKLTPRQFWLLAASETITSSLYSNCTACMSGELLGMWFQGAFLKRTQYKEEEIKR